MALFTIKKGDTKPDLEVTFTQGGSALTEISSAIMYMRHRQGDRTLVLDGVALEASDESSGVWKYDWQSGDTDTYGSYDVEFKLTLDDGSIVTVPTHGYERIVVGQDLE